MTDKQFEVRDGLAEIAPDLPAVVTMIERTARWVHPDTFRALPVWCPDTARGRSRYDAGFENELTSAKGVLKREANIRAAKALSDALGLGPGQKPSNWTVCHIWGYDDAAFAGKSEIVQDPRYYSCIGNMVWLPMPLKGFTDAVPDIKSMLRACAWHLYGWACEHGSVAEQAQRIRSDWLPVGYPESWPTASRSKLPVGTAPFSSRVAENIERTKASIRRKLENLSLTRYPHAEVLDVLRHWKIDL